MDRRYEFVRRSTTRVAVGAGVEPRLRELLDEVGSRDVVVVHDGALGELAAGVATAIGASQLVPVAGGEGAKRLDVAGELATHVRAAGADRGTTLLALGGGTVCDLVGFVAAILLRGVRFAACPTTTLALCDAALGGKNGVDHAGRKNELGTIRQPDLVAADLAWLRTLPDEPFREGFVEAVKMAAVLDAAAFTRLERLAAGLYARDDDAVLAAIDVAIATKMGVVLADEGEQDRRRWLNFGHTIGHALEQHAGGALRHGACVAIGMLAECRAAGVAGSVLAQLHALLAALDVCALFPREHADVEALWALATKDKKARAGVVPMVVPSAIGHGHVVELTPETLAQALA